MSKFYIVSRIEATLLLKKFVHSLWAVRIHLPVLSLRIADLISFPLWFPSNNSSLAHSLSLIAFLIEK